MDTIDNSVARIITPKEPGRGSIGIQFEAISPTGLKLTIVGDSIDPVSERDFLNAVKTLTFVTDPK
jgi:hypothetical protein